MKRAIFLLSMAALLALGKARCSAQSTPPIAMPSLAQLTESGTVVADGRSTRYVIHRLPVSSFPELPSETSHELNRRGCMIPQTYEAHQPENVIHASLERAGASDWAVLCAAKGSVSLLVFFGNSPGDAVELATAQETQSVEIHDLSGVMGFDWGIDRASPLQVREAQAAMEHRPPPLDHDALADTILEKSTIYHFYRKNAWTVLEMPE
jgi:hypothetical protein